METTLLNSNTGRRCSIRNAARLPVRLAMRSSNVNAAEDVVEKSGRGLCLLCFGTRIGERGSERVFCLFLRGEVCTFSYFPIVVSASWRSGLRDSNTRDLRFSRWGRQIPANETNGTGLSQGQSLSPWIRLESDVDVLWLGFFSFWLYSGDTPFLSKLLCGYLYLLVGFIWS